MVLTIGIIAFGFALSIILTDPANASIIPATKPIPIVIGLHATPNNARIGTSKYIAATRARIAPAIFPTSTLSSKRNACVNIAIVAITPRRPCVNCSGSILPSKAMAPTTARIPIENFSIAEPIVFKFSTPVDSFELDKI